MVGYLLGSRSFISPELVRALFIPLLFVRFFVAIRPPAPPFDPLFVMKETGIDKKLRSLLVFANDRFSLPLTMASFFSF